MDIPLIPPPPKILDGKPPVGVPISQIAAKPAVSPPASAPAPVPVSVSSSGPTPLPFSKPIPAPPPMRITLRDSSVPIKNAPDFHSPSSTENIMKGMKSSGPLPVMAAVVELGAKVPSAPNSPQSPKQDTEKVVHYSSLKSQLPMQLPTIIAGKAPTAESGRQVTEITMGTAPAPAQSSGTIPVPVPILVKQPEKIMPSPLQVFSERTQEAKPPASPTFPASVKPAPLVVSAVQKVPSPLPVPAPPQTIFPGKNLGNKPPIVKDFLDGK